MNECTEYFLQHHGIKGQKWGVRRFQDKSGDLTPAGKKRYITVGQAAKNATQARKEAVRSLNESPKKHTLAQYNAAAKKAHRESIAADKAHNKELRAEKKANKTGLTDKQKNAVKVGAIAVGVALTVYGAKKLQDPKVRRAINNAKFEIERRSLARKYDVFPTKFYYW